MMHKNGGGFKKMAAGAISVISSFYQESPSACHKPDLACTLKLNALCVDVQLKSMQRRLKLTAGVILKVLRTIEDQRHHFDLKLLYLNNAHSKIHTSISPCFLL